MMNILIRDVPADVHAELQRRAEQAGRSLQQYLTTELERLVAFPTMDEILDRIESRSGVEMGFEQAATYITEERNER